MWHTADKLPDWRDAGRAIRAVLSHRHGDIEIVGSLHVVDWVRRFDGDDEPVFELVCDDGRRFGFAAAERWRYESDRVSAPN